jgi:2-oxoglutarate ferredoxin oxidoreductase subunit alpha
MTEKVVIPAAEQIEVISRRLTDKAPDDYLPYETNGSPVPEFARAGDGYRFHSTGLTHDEHGYPLMSAECQETCVRRLLDKILEHADDIIRLEEDALEDADIVVVAFGITARVARMATDAARGQGIKVGFLRLITLWPFPENRIRALAARVRGFVVPEINYGQMVLEVERCAAGRAVTLSVPHGGGSVHDPEVIVEAIAEVMR